LHLPGLRAVDEKAAALGAVLGRGDLLQQRDLRYLDAPLLQLAAPDEAGL
jgi:hypothetical protein